MLYIGFKLWLQENLKSCHDFGHPDTIGLAERLVFWDGKSWRDSTTFSPSLPERDWSQRLGQNNRGAIGQNRDAIVDLYD